MKKRLLFILSLIIGGFLGFLFMYLAKEIVKNSNLNIIFAIVFMTGIVLFNLLFSIIFHEFGHMVMGFISNYELLFFRVFSFALVNKDSGFIIKKLKIEQTLGQCLMCPKDEFKDFKYKLYLSGGFIFNLLLCILSIFMFFVFKDNIFVRAIFIWMFLINIFTFLSNAIPLKGLVQNDAMNIKNMNKNYDYRFFIYESLHVSKLFINGKNTGDMKAESVRKLKDINSNFAENYILLGDYYDALGDYNKSTKLYERAMKEEFISGDIQKYLLIDELILNYIILGDSKNLVGLLTDDYLKNKKILNSFPTSLASRFAYNKIVIKDEKSAEKYLDEFNKLEKDYLLEGEILLIKRKIDLINNM